MSSSRCPRCCKIWNRCVCDAQLDNGERRYIEHLRIQPQCPQCHGTGWVLMYGSDPSAPSHVEPANPPADGKPSAASPCLVCRTSPPALGPEPF